MKQLIRFFIICLGMFCFAMPVKAELVNSDQYMDSHMQQLYTSKDGLPTTPATAIAQTNDGFMWFGGYGGLSRYDGKNFQTYCAGQLSNIKCLLCDDENTLWIGSSDKGVAKYEADVLTFIEYKESSERYVIECMTQAEDDTIYFGTERGLGIINEDEEIELLPIDDLYEKCITQVLSVENNIYCITRNGEIYQYDGVDCSQMTIDLNGQKPRCIYYCEENNEFMVGSDDNSVSIYDDQFLQKEALVVDEAKCINSLYYSQDGNTWICADNGVIVYDNETFRKQQMVLNNSVDEMMVDREGNYWFISSRQGILKVSNSRFMNIGQSANLKSEVTNAVFHSGDYLYVGHDEGLEIVDKRTLTQVQNEISQQLADIRIRAINMDKKGNMWFCTNEMGLICFSQSGKSTSYTSSEYPELKSDNFRCIASVDNGDMIAGTDAGAYVITDDGVKNLLTDAASISNRILGIQVVGDRYYLGTDGYGLYQIHDGEIEAHYTIQNGLTSNVVMKIYKSQVSDLIWLVTGNNLAYITADGEIHNVENFPSTNILDIIIQEDGIDWVVTGGGIYRISEESLITGELVYEHLTQLDGMPFDCTANSQYCIIEDDLYLCGTDGVFRMNMNESVANFKEYPITIDYMIADDEPFYVGNKDEIHVGADIKRLVLQVHIPTFVPENPTVFYYLEGFDRNQTVLKLRDLEDVIYTNLEGETYTFHFGILDEETGNVINERLLVIDKEKRLFEKAWTRGLLFSAIVLLFIGCLYAGIRYKNKKMQEELEAFYKKQEQEKLARMAYIDQLTGSYNRNYMDLWSTKELKEQDFPVTMIVADCNDLKVINDSYGHKEGDRLLQTTAQLLGKYFDDEQCAIVRAGGDEFIVLCRATSTEIAQKKMDAFMEEFSGQKIQEVPMSLCYGICSMGQEEYAFSTCLKAADMKLLEQKRIYHTVHDRRKTK